MAYLRFQRRISLPGGFRINLSKSGVGVSAGIPGLRAGAGPRGARITAGLPGTGLSIVHQGSSGGSARANRINITPTMIAVASRPRLARAIIRTYDIVTVVGDVITRIALWGLAGLVVFAIFAIVYALAGGR